MSEWIRYCPLDSLLERYDVRVLRALRWFDWVELNDLRVAMSIDTNTERQGFWRAVRSLVADGRIVQDKDRVRLAPKGKRHLARELDRAIPRFL